MRFTLITYVLAICVGLAAGVVVVLFKIQEQRSRAQFEIEAAHSELELALATLSVRMASIATSLERATETSPENYGRFYADVGRVTDTARERAMALMLEFTSTNQAQQFVGALSDQFTRAGYPEFGIFPTDPAEALFPAVFVEPPASRANVFGYNIGSSPERLSAARAALESGVMTTSVPLTLSQDNDLSNASFLLLYPVYLPNPELVGGSVGAVLGAGMTPRDLFDEYVVLNSRHAIEIEVGIAGVPLPVLLGADEALRGPRIAIWRDFAMPDIATNGGGFSVPFTATVFYVPRMSDVLLPIFASLLSALLVGLLAKVYFAREEAKRKLEIALVQKEAKLREAYQIQARSQRIEALGQLVGGVAHDFNNIMSVILGNLELAKDEGSTNEDDQLIDEAIKATLRGAVLTRQLLAVGRKSHLQPQTLSVAEIVHESERMLRRVLPESIEITCIPAAGLWAVIADPNGLQNAILNVALNARDAMDARGKLTIEASNTRATHDYIDQRPDEEIVPGRYVLISITDDGSGMTPEVRDRAFEPFFTTKHATEGSGLGLASVLGFCRQSGGTCRIYSELGIGTTIKMYLPVSDVTETPAEAQSQEPSDLTRHGRILLAEDEDSVARVIVRQLKAAGYAVRRVPTGDAAWAELESGRPFDLLISDLVMPGTIQGAELVRLAEDARPGLAVLLISGYPQEAAIEGNGVAKRHPVLTKPIARIDLLRTVDRLLQ